VTIDDAVKPGRARSEGVSAQEILHKEARTQSIPDVLLEESYQYLGSEDLPIERYISPEYARLEAERLWPKVWQMACRTEEIPNVGDYHVYDVANYSILIVRVTEAGEQGPGIKAYHNSCLHRGTQLKDADGSAPFFRCPFHGWTWNLDGTLKRITTAWDFPHVDKEKFCLPECLVETWGGFVFINMDRDAGPLSEWLEVLPGHFRNWPLENHLKAVHVAKVLPCNWKVGLEAFIEAYHVGVTHPQLAMIDGDENTQYDIYGRHVSRFVNLFGTPSPAMGELDEQTIAEAFGQAYGGFDVEVPDGLTARDVIGEIMQTQIGAGTGLDLGGLSTAETIDAIEYYVFPNFLPWASLGVPIVYRFRPNGMDPDTCIMDVMLLSPLPDGLPERPPPAPVFWLESDDWREAPGLGLLGPTFNQDMSNVYRLQRGLKASVKGTVTLADYQEIRIRHYHRELERYVGK
jgi:phenylpropionate dioxygenase-like ring-hydroxylating dioxygenase large terminal subunit